MKIVFGLCIVLFAGSLLAADDKKKDADKKDLQKLAGKWQPTSMLIGKNKTSDEDLKTFTLALEGDTYTFSIKGEKEPDKGKFKIDANAKPMTMDIITGKDSPNKGKILLAIYELDGDTMKICYDREGKKRPTEFKADSDKTLLAVYKRMK